MKRIIALVLCMIMCLSALAGCGKDDKKANANEDWDGKITIGIPDNALVQDYNTNKFSVWLEETTGYDIEFQVLAATAADRKSQLATMVAGGEELPDIIYNMGLSDAEIKSYGDDRYFLDLKEYLEDKEMSKNFWSLLEESYPDKEQREYLIERATDQENGAIYALPSMEISEIDCMDYQVYINTAWLKKLNLEMPTDNESLFEVLKAFVNQDPNGNGKKDEIGIMGQAEGTFGQSTVGWLLNNFFPVSLTYHFNVNEKGKLSLPYATKEYREALIYMNKLVNEGLMSKSLWNIATTDVKQYINPVDGVNKIGVMVAHPSVVLQNGYANHSEYEALPLWGYAMKHENTYSKSVHITESCKNVEAAWEVLMAMYTKEAGYRLRYGEYKVDWDYADEGAKSFLGLPAEIKVLNEQVWSTNNNQNWHTTYGTIMNASENEVTQLSDDMDDWVKTKYRLMKGAYDEFNKAYEAKPYVEMQKLLYTVAEEEQVEIEMANCKAWIETMRAKFVCGTDNLDPANDDDWDKYLKELNKLGVDTWLEQAQKVYDRQLDK